MLRSLSIVAVATLALAWPDTASAGPLSKVVGGLKEKSGQDDSNEHSSQRSSSTNDEADTSDAGEPSPDYGSHDDAAMASEYAYEDEPYDGGGMVLFAPSTYGAGADVDVYAGLHRVGEATGAATVTMRASYGDFGLSVGNVGYYERMGEETIGLHLWSISAAWRAHRPTLDAPTQVWLTGGLAGAHSDGLDLFGVALGAEATHRLGGVLGLEGTGRFIAYQDDIRAVEFRGGIAASFVRLSYRVLKFNAGPALHGPEFGIALGF